MLVNEELEYQEQHLLFIKNVEVPFDNNMAERALRMIKTKKNVSGGFRSKDLAENTKSFLQCQKQEMNLFETAKDAFRGKTIEFLPI